MPSIFRIAAAAMLTCAPIAAQAADDHRNFMLGSYEEIVVEGDMQVNIVNSAGPSANAQGNAKLVDAVRIERNGRVVRVRLDPNARTGAAAAGGALQINMTGRDIRKITLRGSALVNIDTVKAKLGQFDIRGAGEIRIGDLQAEKMQGMVNGSGRLSIGKGKTNSGSILLNGTGALDAPEFSFGTLTLFQSGAASTTTSASREVTITNSGSGVIDITGLAHCVVRQAGSATINCAKMGGVR